MKKEYWKPVFGYEEHYQISNFGRVKSFDTYRKGRNGSVRCCKGRILKPFTNRHGYLQVDLCKNGKVKKFLVHRLVAEAFLDNPNNLPQVNHKDENPQNNNVENLEFCSAKYNTNFGNRNKRIAEKNTNGKLSKKVYQYTLDGQFVREWESTAECDRNGFDHGNVAACCRGKLKKYKDFIWRYKNPSDLII